VLGAEAGGGGKRSRLCAQASALPRPLPAPRPAAMAAGRWHQGWTVIGLPTGWTVFHLPSTPEVPGAVRFITLGRDLKQVRPYTYDETNHRRAMAGRRS
jgi:hypothetical protein